MVKTQLNKPTGKPISLVSDRMEFGSVRISCITIIFDDGSVWQRVFRSGELKPEWFKIYPEEEGQ